MTWIVVTIDGGKLRLQLEHVAAYGNNMANRCELWLVNKRAIVIDETPEELDDMITKIMP